MATALGASPLVKRSLSLMRVVMRALNRALPDTDRELIGGFCADLFDLWETGQTLEKKLKEICRMRFPRDSKKLYDTLIWVDAIQIDMGSYWIGEVKKDLPKLLRALDKLERKTPSRKQKRQPAKAQQPRRRTRPRRSKGK